MKTRSTPLIPIAIAVLATVGVGAYLKRSAKAAEEPSKIIKFEPPKDLWVEVIETSTGPRPSDFAERVANVAVGAAAAEPAVWVRYKVLANGKERTPERANDRLTFEVRDSKGRLWPSYSVSTKQSNYLLVPKGYPVLPESLSLNCRVGFDRSIGEWKLPTPGPVVDRHLKPSPPGAILKDFDGLGVRVVGVHDPDSETSLIAVRTKTPEQKAGNSVYVNLVGHDYGLLPSSMSGVWLPHHFSERIRNVEVVVHKTKSSKHTIDVQLPAAEIAGLTGGSSLRFAAPLTFPVEGGVLSFRAMPPAGPLGIYPTIKFSSAGRNASVSTISASLPEVTYKSAGIGSAPYLNFAFPAGQTKIPKVTLKVEYWLYESSEKDYVLPLQWEKSSQTASHVREVVPQ